MAAEHVELLVERGIHHADKVERQRIERGAAECDLQEEVHVPGDWE